MRGVAWPGMARLGKQHQGRRDTPAPWVFLTRAPGWAVPNAFHDLVEAAHPVPHFIHPVAIRQQRHVRPKRLVGRGRRK
jgi:hypothetical protein